MVDQSVDNNTNSNISQTNVAFNILNGKILITDQSDNIFDEIKRRIDPSIENTIINLLSHSKNKLKDSLKLRDLYLEYLLIDDQKRRDLAKKVILDSNLSINEKKDLICNDEDISVIDEGIRLVSKIIEFDSEADIAPILIEFNEIKNELNVNLLIDQLMSLGIIVVDNYQNPTDPENGDYLGRRRYDDLNSNIIAEYNKTVEIPHNHIRIINFSIHKYIIDWVVWGSVLSIIITILFNGGMFLLINDRSQFNVLTGLLPTVAIGFFIVLVFISGFTLYNTNFIKNQKYRDFQYFCLKVSPYRLTARGKKLSKLFSR